MTYDPTDEIHITYAKALGALRYWLTCGGIPDTRVLSECRRIMDEYHLVVTK